MKRLVFSISALTIIAALCVCSSILSKKSVLQFSKTASSYAAQIRHESEIQTYADELEKQWEKKRKVLLLFIDEDVFTQTTLEIIDLKWSVSTDDFKAQCEKVSHLAKKIAENRLPLLRNVFRG